MLKRAATECECTPPSSHHCQVSGTTSCRGLHNKRLRALKWLWLPVREEVKAFILVLNCCFHYNVNFISVYRPWCFFINVSLSSMTVISYVWNTNCYGNSGGCGTDTLETQMTYLIDVCWSEVTPTQQQFWWDLCAERYITHKEGHCLVSTVDGARQSVLHYLH